MSPGSEHLSEFVRLLTRHQAGIRAFIVSQMPGLPGVADVLQDVNVILWEKKDSFELGTNFSAWAFKIARFQVLNHRRKLQRQGHVTLSDEMLDQLAQGMEETLDSTEMRLEALEFCLNKLQLHHRELVEERYLSASSLVEYARRINRPVGSLRTTLKRLRVSLRKCVDSQVSLEEKRV
ncbi:sigma-70 family RNA polymerase sigma factor [Sulfuriroseicoccus oceanibius]|uniref:Sigma-70 family RNA polymerase sigma factor n=1 Tax=Sulfuriroseicoccus oceanibius TaxID=2707525 RepID=A0A6B3LBB8_9BACT|nr:sigma-70 family RNA polymerase sigma factor [Sulfuriroseicoccus oceanibius]QQL45856.1 sigma-70 family RNA polymerase sigma factor [Sulfuriroseicoccus oceanibius]